MQNFQKLGPEIGIDPVQSSLKEITFNCINPAVTSDKSNI